MVGIEAIQAQFKLVLGEKYVVTDQAELNAACSNSLALPREIVGILRPLGINQVIETVLIARRYKQSLYPISRGRNLGYGDMTPVQDGSWLLDLSRNDKIREIDYLSGQATVEPGVTQQILHDELLRRGMPFIISATGAHGDASILGNTVAGGFSHGPRGNHRQSLVQLKAVLGDGTLITTGQPFGPSLTGLGIQFNGAIIMEATIQLEAKPERFESFMIRASAEQLPQLIDGLRLLRLRRTANSVIHLGNRVRLAQSVAQLPPDFDRSQPMTEDDAMRLLTVGYLKPAWWTAVGGLYGSREEVKAKRKAIRRQLSNVASVVFFTDRRISFLDRLLAAKPLPRWEFFRGLRRQISSYRELHQLLQGQPSDVFVKNISWRVADPNDLGLMWICPTVPANATSVLLAMSAVEKSFEQFGFGAPPWTWSYIEETQLVGISNLCFDKRSQSEVTRAHQAYTEIMKAFGALSIPTYRASTYGMANGLIKYDPATLAVLTRLKEAFDPDHVIAPGLYGIA